MKLLIKHVIFTLLTIFMIVLFLFKWVDRQCVVGRLSQVQVDSINALPWEKCPKYNRGVCVAEKDARVWTGGCSEASRSFFLRDMFGFDWFYNWYDNRGQDG